MGLTFPKSCSEGFVCVSQSSPVAAAADRNAAVGLVQAQRCPAGMSCTSTTMEPCPPGKISTSSTGKCVSCEDKQFAHQGKNVCGECPDDPRVVKCTPGDAPQMVDANVYCARCFGAGVALDALDASDFMPCRTDGACNTTLSTADFTVRTGCRTDAVY